MPPKVATRSSLEQIAILDSMLARPEGASIGELMDRMECCEKTVKRHIAWMCRKLGVLVRLVGNGSGLERRLAYRTDRRVFTDEALRMLV
jgi:hypothetical protein